VVYAVMLHCYSAIGRHTACIIEGGLIDNGIIVGIENG
jgi:hypothetical protein